VQYSRQTYDILRLIGDIGGLASGVILLAQILVTSYSQFNASAFLLHKMFKTSSDEFRKQRNLMKPALSNFMKKEGGLNESSEGDDTYLRNLSTATIIGYIKDDLINRIPIPHPSLFWILKGTLCRLKSYRKYLKLHKRS
jgi:hypothetical protein